jgi:predicted alpha/beta-fold hydrolase
MQYVAKAKEDCVFKAVVGIGNFYDCEKAMNHMSTYFFGFYDYILGTFCRIMAEPLVKEIDAINAKQNPDKIIGEDLYKVNTLNQYIDYIILRTENFRNLQHYYHEASCTHRLQDIKVPVFFLSANDDPIMGKEVIPIEKCHENILIGVTKAGGHLGYFEGMLLPHRQWFPEPTFEFLNFYAKQSTGGKKLRKAHSSSEMKPLLA